MRKSKLLTGLFAGAGIVSTAANAAGPDLSTLTSAVDFGTVVAAVLGVGAAIIVLDIAWKGAKRVIAAVRGA